MWWSRFFLFFFLSEGLYRQVIGYCEPSYNGDLYCDESNNSEECDYDGGMFLSLSFEVVHQYDSKQFLKFHVLVGDCCLEYIKTQYCYECICHEDGTRHPEWPCSDYNIGDGTCHDSQNVEVCEYDGGKFVVSLCTFTIASFLS